MRKIPRSSATVRRRPGRRLSPAGAAVGVWAGLIAASHIAVRVIEAFGSRMYIDAPPLFGWFSVRVSLWVVPAVALAGIVVGVGPHIAARLPWRVLLCVLPLVAGAWAVALTLFDGPEAITRPLEHPADFLAGVPLMTSPSSFLATFAEEIDTYPTHVQGHPPGIMLLLWWMERAGLGGSGPAAAVLIAAGALAVPACLLALRDLAGGERARAAAPFLVLAPLWMWVATTGNALFLGLGTWGVALCVLATGRRGLRSDLLALAGGLLCGLALFSSWGAVPLGVVVLTVAYMRRRIRPLVLGALPILALVAAFGGFGFWWWEGLLATREQYAAGVARLRPYPYFIFGNLAAFGIALGPAVAAGLARLRDNGTWVLVAGGLIAVVLTNLSGLSKGEVERIWLHLAPWVLIATTALAHRGYAHRGWLAAQGTFALVVGVVVWTPW